MSLHEVCRTRLNHIVQQGAQVAAPGRRVNCFRSINKCCYLSKCLCFRSITICSLPLDNTENLNEFKITKDALYTDLDIFAPQCRSNVKTNLFIC